MRRPGVRFKARTLMVAVAIVAIALAAFRVENAPGAAIAIIGSCVFYLARKRYSEALDLRQARGLTMSRRQKAVRVFSAVTIAAAVIGVSDFAFLAGYYGFLKLAYETVVMSHWTPYDDPGYMGAGAVIGIILALPVASCLRRTFWADEVGASVCPRRWLKLWPVLVAVLVALALGLEEMRQRWRFCTMMADYHATPERWPDGSKKEELHAWLKRWYEKAAFRPWLPIHPDHIPQGL